MLPQLHFANLRVPSIGFFRLPQLSSIWLCQIKLRVMPASLVSAPFTADFAPVDSAILQVSFAAILCSLSFTLLIYAFPALASSAFLNSTLLINALPALAVPNQAQSNANFTSTSTFHCWLRSS